MPAKYMLQILIASLPNFSYACDIQQNFLEFKIQFLIQKAIFKSHIR